jgi:hypothetical protein
VDAINTILKVAEDMKTPTYADNGKVNVSPYTYRRPSDRASETLENDGLGNPVQGNTGLIRTAFRPSDDAAIYQFYIPSLMQFATYLSATGEIMKGVGNQRNLANLMTNTASNLRDAISKHGIVDDPNYGTIYAFEVDGYGGRNIMDDANIPGLLSAPFIGYLDRNDKVYQATRKFILSTNNPYYMHGPLISSVGGPHIGPGMAWPMASIVQIFTTDDDNEIRTVLKEILSTTDGLGLIHESISTFNATIYTRQWFSWANGLFGQMILDLESRKPYLLKESYQ